MNMNSLYKAIRPYFNSRRFLLFKELLQPGSGDRILDIGGYHWFWEQSGITSRITFININIPDNLLYDKSRYEYIKGDARCLPFKDKEFDIAFSNSVIEHVGGEKDKALFAHEARRVADCYWVQTPNRKFFIEPHLVAPFIHFLPIPLQKKMARNFTMWGILTRPDRKQIDDYLGDTAMLSGAEFRNLFPEAILIEEKFLLMTKSFTAYTLRKRK